MNQTSQNTSPGIIKKTRFTPIGYTKYLKKFVTNSILFRDHKLLESLAIKSWKIAASKTSIVPKAYYLEGQLDRVTGTAVTGNPNLLMPGGNEKYHAPTRAYFLQDLYMLNGNLYKGFKQIHFHPKHQLSRNQNYFPPLKVDTEINMASIYHSFDGFKAFGIWLSDDCTMYHLAAEEGVPVTSNVFASPHMLEYESLLNMTPVRSNAVRLKKAVLFNDDWGNNNNKHERFATNRKTLLSRFSGTKHPGVFIIRGNSGNSRVMLNEIEIAEQLRQAYGFKIVDVNKNSVSEILEASVGAQLVIGVEGSHLMHGLMVLEPGTSLLAMQPPNRFCGVLKMTTDMEGIYYGFVVGISKEEGFYVDLEEVKKTIDMLPKT